MADEQGAIEIEWADGTVGYVILTIHEYRNSGARFRLWDKSQNGSHLLTAGEVRANWNAWVGELVPAERVVDERPAEMEVY